MQQEHDTHLQYGKGLPSEKMLLLNTWFERLSGDLDSTTSEHSRLKSKKLITMLELDTIYDSIYISNFSLDPTSCDLSLVMVRDNDYYSLELIWSMS